MSDYKYKKDIPELETEFNCKLDREGDLAGFTYKGELIKCEKSIGSLKGKGEYKKYIAKAIATATKEQKFKDIISELAIPNFKIMDIPHLGYVKIKYSKHNLLAEPHLDFGKIRITFPQVKEFLYKKISELSKHLDRRKQINEWIENRKIKITNGYYNLKLEDEIYYSSGDKIYIKSIIYNKKVIAKDRELISYNIVSNKKFDSQEVEKKAEEIIKKAIANKKKRKTIANSFTELKKETGIPFRPSGTYKDKAFFGSVFEINRMTNGSYVLSTKDFPSEFYCHADNVNDLDRIYAKAKYYQFESGKERDEGYFCKFKMVVTPEELYGHLSFLILYEPNEEKKKNLIRSCILKNQ